MTALRTIGRIKTIASDILRRVYIDHGYVDGNNIETKYCHMESKPLVSNGVNVNDGKNLGYMGATGQVTGKHLHFEFIVDGSAKDPKEGRLFLSESVVEIKKVISFEPTFMIILAF